MVALEQGYLCGCSEQQTGELLSGVNWELGPWGCNDSSVLAHCVALGKLCPTWAQSQNSYLNLFFFFSQSQQENICFFYTFLVYLSWDLQLCCCRSVHFNNFEAIAVSLVPKLPGWPCCLYVSSYFPSAWHELQKKDKEKLCTESFIISASLSLQDSFLKNDNKGNKRLLEKWPVMLVCVLWFVGKHAA